VGYTAVTDNKGPLSNRYLLLNYVKSHEILRNLEFIAVPVIQGYQSWCQSKATSY